METIYTLLSEYGENEMELLVIIGIVVVLWIAIRKYSKKKRREALLAKYGDPKVVEMILNRSIWQGQTQEQLIDSLGRPADIDQKVLKSKTKETWKYNKTGSNRFGLRVIVEDRVVVGWDKKD
jgi:uncharacterized protein YpuA (DUF1002 family)